MQDYINGPISIHKLMQHLEPVVVKSNPGELICVVCGKPIDIDTLPENPTARKYLIKWRMHEECEKESHKYIDAHAGEQNRHKPRHLETKVEKGTFLSDKF